MLVKFYIQDFVYDRALKSWTSFRPQYVDKIRPSKKISLYQ